MGESTYSGLFEGPAMDIVYLALCWALTLTTSTLLTTIGPVSAQNIGASKVLAPFTIGVFLFGAAFSSVPSGALFRKYGRLKGFSVGCLCQVIGSIIGSGGMVFESVGLVFVGCFFVGLGQGLGQFYRFSAVEIAPPSMKSQAITYVLSGGVLAAFLGPTSANFSRDMITSREYLGSYLAMGMIGILNQGFCMMVRFPDSQNVYDKLLKSDEEASRSEAQSSGHGVAEVVPEKNRPIMEIISQPLFIVSCAVATMAHTLMVMVMSNCSLAMINAYGYSFRDSARVMELHFGSMFGPGFFTGKLIASYGAFLVALGGAVIFAGSSVVFLSGTELWNFYVGMSLLGIGWNFSFSAGTVMLTGSYKKSEATDVQAVNDFILFTVAGVGSLVSGFVYSASNWNTLIYVVTGMMLFNVILFSVSWRIKAKLEQQILLAEEAEYDDEEEDLAPGVVGSPFHPVGDISKDQSLPGSTSDAGRRSRSVSRASVDGGGLPTSLYQENPAERKERLSSLGSRRGSRGSSRSDRKSMSQYAGGGDGEETRRKPSIADMFTPAPVHDPDDRIRLNSFTAV